MAAKLRGSPYYARQPIAATKSSYQVAGPCQFGLDWSRAGRRRAFAIIEYNDGRSIDADLNVAMSSRRTNCDTTENVPT